MLELLRIHDLALIEDLEMDFASGLNVLTGETGAGKSFILKAINFLLGEKLETDLVRPGKEKAIVEALFVLDGEDTILRRELAADSGRSRVYINDRLCSQEVIKELRPKLILHTSQHGQQKLLQPAFQAAILDDFLNRPDLLEKKDSLVRALSDCALRIAKLDEARLALEDKREVLEYQQQEIDKVAPQAGEEEELEMKRAASRNQTGISESASAALAALHGDESGPGLYKYLGTLERSLESLSGMLEEFNDTPDTLAEVKNSLQEIERRLRKASRHASQEEDIEAIEARLFALAQLKRKLKRSLSSIVSLQQEIAENLDFLDTCELERAKLQEEENSLCAELSALLSTLNAARQEAAIKLSSALQDELKNLGFSEHVEVIFEFTPVSLYKKREDCCELRTRLFWKPNPGQAPQPLDRIASGGELSRFLLALVTLMSKNASEKPSLIFDEVDSGVGGMTLNRVADSLEKLASDRQMLLITHWPQLASRATRHFVIQKEIIDGQTYTKCRRLAQEDIAKELARMSGDSI